MERLWRWGPGFFLAVTSSGEQTTGKCSWSHCTALSASAFWVFGLNRWGWGEVFLNTIFVLRQSISMCVFPFGLQCFILLLLGPQCWDYKCIPPQTVGMATNTVSLASRLLSGYRRKRHILRASRQALPWLSHLSSLSHLSGIPSFMTLQHDTWDSHLWKLPLGYQKRCLSG